jgi:magnesium chelatase subunit D
MDPTARIRMALAVLAVAPLAIGGLWLRARACPQRDIVTAALAQCCVPQRRLHPSVSDDALSGGLDLAATLGTGRPVMRAGLLSGPALLVLPMAERCPPGLAARLGQALDRHGQALVALDEGAEADETLPSALSDRLGLFLALDGLSVDDIGDVATPDSELATARGLLPSVGLAESAISAMAGASAELGIGSARAPLLALSAARVLAALDGRSMVTEADLCNAAELVLAHRAAPVTEAAPITDDGQQSAAEPQASERPEAIPEDIPAEMLVEVARAALPEGLLNALAQGRSARATKGGGGTGDAHSGNRRGRPLPSRPGRPDCDHRLDLIATLRAAAPWQGLRRAEARGPSRALYLKPADLRIRRVKEMSDRVLVFAVDASGSSAMARMSEAKGAVELLLGQAYSRRDHVALVVFRGEQAELLLPPTRSLVQTKQRLRAVPGGGGTPLASALHLALATAGRARARGMTPTLALLTDGRGNVALDGSPGRDRADADTLRMAQAIRASNLSTLVIDVSNRPQPGLAALAAQMGGRYAALPRADAQRLSAVLENALEA